MDLEQLLHNLDEAHQNAVKMRDGYSRDADGAMHQFPDRAQGLHVASMAHAAVAEALGIILGKPTPGSDSIDKPVL